MAYCMYFISLQRITHCVCILGMIYSLSACCSTGPQSPCAHKYNHSNPSTSKVPKVKKPLVEIRGGQHLEDLHPHIRKLAQVLYEKAEDTGIEIRFISGYRKYRVKKKVKKNGSLASWHNLGLAFDVNLVGRKGMRDALKHWKDDQVDWQKLGKIAKGLGLTWGLAWGRKEVFHFEWHPGYPDAIRKKTLRVLQKQGGVMLSRFKTIWPSIKP